MKEFITKTTKEIKDNVEYITHYVNRPIQIGDPQGGPIGECVNGISKITKIIKYIYK